MCHYPNSQGNGEKDSLYDGPVLLVYRIPDPDSKVGNWKVVSIPLPSYDAAFIKTVELPRIAWGEIKTFDDKKIIKKFGVEER